MHIRFMHLSGRPRVEEDLLRERKMRSIHSKV
uniref:Uncharacterized protein n=1 Tax=Parascaris univalens TaxID=6257 RepID=A0A914ZQU0_PARUN